MTANITSELTSIGNAFRLFEAPSLQDSTTKEAFHMTEVKAILNTEIKQGAN